MPFIRGKFRENLLFVNKKKEKLMKKMDGNEENLGHASVGVCRKFFIT